MRQTGGGVCHLGVLIARYTFPEEGSVEKSLSHQARREAFIDADATCTPRPSGFDPA